MEINVSELLKAPVGENRSYSVNETIKEGFPLWGNLKLVRTNRGILVTGKLKAQLKATCSRCLEKFKFLLPLELEEECFPAATPSSALPEESFVIGRDNILNLDEAIRQHTLLNFPIKPICRPDCAGLCPYCGKNLNYGPCGCPQEPADARLAPLKDLFQK